MTYEEFYGSSYEVMKKAEGQLLELIRQYCCSRIKSPESMTEKLEKRQLPVTCEAALHEVYDAVGIRVVCAFAEDVYQVVSWLADRPYIRVIQSKDYIAYPKPNGYRSYHMLIELQEGEEKGYFA